MWISQRKLAAMKGLYIEIGRAQMLNEQASAALARSRSQRKALLEEPLISCVPRGKSR